MGKKESYYRTNFLTNAIHSCNKDRIQLYRKMRSYVCGEQKMLYLNIGTLFAIYAEWSKTFAARPLFEKSEYKDELIFDLPFCRVIYTPGKCLKRKNKDESNTINTADHIQDGHKTGKRYKVHGQVQNSRYIPYAAKRIAKGCR